MGPHCYEMNCAPLKMNVKALTPIVTIFGNRTYEKVITVKYGPKGRALIQ